MRAFLIPLLLILLPVAAWAQSGEYTIVETNPALSTFTGKSRETVRTFRVRAGSGITINSQEATFEEIAVGMRAKVTSANPGVATQIAATGMRNPAAPIATTPSATASPAAAAPTGSPSDPFVGHWFWHHNILVEFKADGTATSNVKSSGTWRFMQNAEVQRKYQVDWDHGKYIDTVILSEDGKTALLVSKLGKYNIRRSSETSATTPSPGGSQSPSYFGAQR